MLNSRLALFVLSLLISPILFASSLESMIDKEAIRKKYNYLYQEQIKTFSDGSKAFHNARLYKRDRLNVLFLKGDSFEVAFQHGALLSAEIQKGAIIQSSQMIQNTIRNSFGYEGLIPTIAMKYVDRQIVDKILKHTINAGPKIAEQVAHSALGISDTTGIPMNALADAAIAPDTLMYLAAMSNKGGLFPIIRNVESHCTSFTAWDNYTRDGGLILGRNLDFPLTAFDDYPTLIYVEPSEGQKFLSIVSAGIQFFGITAINESGIYISLHTLPTPETSTERIPLLVTGTRILREAHTFDEAVALLRANPPPTGWTYDLISLKERRVGSVEMSASNVAVRESTGGFHVQTNHYLTPELKDKMLYINRSIDEDSFARYNRAEAVLKFKRGRFEKSDAAALLGDHYDPISGKERGVGNTVSVHTTVTSVVLVEREKSIYVSTGNAPTGHHRFISFPLPSEANALTFSKFQSKAIEGSQFHLKQPQKANAIQLFIRSKEAYEYRADYKGALALINEVVRADGTNPHYQFVRGIVALKVNDLPTANDALNATLATALTKHQGHLAHYYLGRMFAAQRDKVAAIQHLEVVTTDPEADQKLKDAASKALRQVKLFGGYQLKSESLSILYQQADMEKY